MPDGGRRWRARAAVGALTALAACTAPQSPVASVPAPEQEPVAPPSRIAPPVQASALIGASPDRVEAALGPPALRRDEGTAQIWLYASPSGCRINLVLVQDGGRERVATAAAHTDGRLSEAACLRSIAAARSRAPSSPS